VDIEQGEDAWIVEAELPGVDPKDVSVELNESELAITGEIKERERKGILRRRERHTGRFDYRVTRASAADIWSAAPVSSEVRPVVRRHGELGRRAGRRTSRSSFA
jgi:HSP20 family protein